jgi:nucleotide-binding universal stress UspA family protein
MRYGTAEARRLGAATRLVHVVPGYLPISTSMPFTPAELTEVGDRILREATATARALAPDLAIESSLRQGSRTLELTRAAADASLLVVGRTDRSVLERLVTGTTAVSVASRSAVPTVSVPGSWHDGGIRTVLVGIRSHHHAEKLLGDAFDLAVTHGARLRALHAWRLSSEYDDVIASRTREQEWTERSREEMERLLRPWREIHPDLPVDVEVVHGHAVHALVAASRDADLLVIVRRPRDIPALRHLGGTGRAVLQAAECPVRVVPPEAAAPPGSQLRRRGALATR